MTRRSRRNTARVLALVLAAGAVLSLLAPGSAGADGTSATLAAKGWWWRAQSSTLPASLPLPPNVESGQLNVQGNPTDAKGTAFAAVRYTVAEGQSVTSLVLKVGANGDQGGATAVLLACRTGSAWTAADGGAWESAPKVDSSACVNGQRASDGASWTFAVGPLQLPGLLDVAIVPGVDPSTKQTSTFSLVFDAPGADSVTATAGTTPPATNVTAGSPAPSAVGASSPAPSGVSRPASSPISVPTGLPADKVGQTATAPAQQAATRPGLDTALDAVAAAKTRDKWPGIVVLVLAALIGLYAWRQDNLMAMNGGTLAGADAVSGLGRFARARDGQPPALT
jgi:hypothetical protein